MAERDEERCISFCTIGTRRREYTIWQFCHVVVEYPSSLRMKATDHGYRHC